MHVIINETEWLHYLRQGRLHRERVHVEFGGTLYTALHFMCTSDRPGYDALTLPPNYTASGGGGGGGWAGGGWGALGGGKF